MSKSSLENIRLDSYKDKELLKELVRKALREDEEITPLIISCLVEHLDHIADNPEEIDKPVIEKIVEKNIQEKLQGINEKLDRINRRLDSIDSTIGYLMSEDAIKHGKLRDT